MTVFCTIYGLHSLNSYFACRHFLVSKLILGSNASLKTLKASDFLNCFWTIGKLKKRSFLRSTSFFPTFDLLYFLHENTVYIIRVLDWSVFLILHLIISDPTKYSAKSRNLHLISSSKITRGFITKNKAGRLFLLKKSGTGTFYCPQHILQRQQFMFVELPYSK